MFLSTVEEVSNKLIEINNNLKLFYEENYEDMKQNYIDLITQLDELVNIFDLPFKYRNINDIYLLIASFNVYNLLEFMLEKSPSKIIIIDCILGGWSPNIFFSFLICLSFCIIGFLGLEYLPL